ncbi:MAG TPA: helix-turn-helix transcriptional regulator [Vicinamibacterales bacterium]
MPPRAPTDRPLKPLVFEILLALAGGPSHGWTIVRSLQERSPGSRILPGHFYRTLSRALADGLIEEARPQPARGIVDERRRYFRLTPLGHRAAAAEARRLESLVAESRAKRLLSSRSRS